VLNGRLHAKTGSLQGVTGLAGFVDTGRAVVFSYLASGSFNSGTGVGMRGQVAEIIGQFPDAPAADQLVPMPKASTPAASP
jgi:D-alanyl-D-alanine carboxypeptidase